MHWPIPIILFVASGGLMLAERRGTPVVLGLHFKGDLKRETRWFAQYGQAACTIVVAALLWRLDTRTFGIWWPCGVVLTSVFGTSIIAMMLKRVLGRVRPGREQAGKFLGPSIKHANYRESFPSSHSACAAAMTVALNHLYPTGIVIFWALAIICAGLRYLMDAHWPSDVLGGLAIGIAVAELVCHTAGV